MRPTPTSLPMLGTLILVAGGATTALAQDDPQMTAQLVIEVSAAGEEEGEPVGSVHSGTLRQGRSRSFSARLEAGRCYLFAASGAPDIDNLDVAVARGRTVLTRDGDTGRRASARHCAGERAERVRWTVTAFRGSGAYAAGLFRLPEGSTAEDPEASGETALERLGSLRDAHGSGMRPVTTPARERLEEGQRLERSVRLEPGRCYRVLAAGEDGMEDVDLALVTPRGSAVQTDTGEGGATHLGVLRPLCPATPGEYTVAIRAHRGGGALAWQVLGSAPERRRDRAESRATSHRVGGSGSGFVSERIRARHRVAGEGRPPVTDLVEGSLRTSETHELSLPVQGGRCYVVLAAGVPSVRELDLRILDPFGNERASDDTHDALPAARVCPSIAGTWKVQVRMFNGYGRFGVQAFGGPR